MAFQQGLSGLNAASKNLDVISNNIANVGTVGFKSSRTEFADVYASAGYGANNLQPGLGAQTVSVAQQFNQGGFTVTNNPLDVAISGNGFLRLKNDSDMLSYTRNGQLRMDKDGFLVTNTGENVTGYTSLTLDSSFNISGASMLGNIKIDLNGINANATENIALSVNLNSTAVSPVDTTPVIAPAIQPLVVQFDPLDSTSYNYSTSLSVYDSLGTEHSIQYYFVKEDTNPALIPPTPNTWTVYAYMDGTVPGFLPTPPLPAPLPVGNQINLGGTNPPPGLLGGHTLTFDLSGNLLTGAIGGNQLAPIDLTASGALPLSMTVDFTGSSQFAGNSGVNFVSQDGVQSASLVNVNISDDGVISGRYSNGVNKPLQQLVLVTFRNPQALAPIGQNQWAMTIDAGDETINAPGMGIAGTLQAQAVEDSTTDLTAELVNLIIAQRLYQANAQSISAQNTILQTLVNLR